MNLVTRWEDLVGKTIIGSSSDWQSRMLVFDDGSFAVIELDYSCCWYEGDRPTIELQSSCGSYDEKTAQELFDAFNKGK